MDLFYSSILNSSFEGVINLILIEFENFDLESDLKIFELLISILFVKYVIFVIESSDFDRLIVINLEFLKVVVFVSEELVLEMVLLFENGCDSYVVINVLEDNLVFVIENGD